MGIQCQVELPRPSPLGRTLELEAEERTSPVREEDALIKSVVGVAEQDRHCHLGPYEHLPAQTVVCGK